MTIKKRDPDTMKPAKPAVVRPLLDDLRRIIEETRQAVATTVNTALTMLYWRIGKRINEEILKGQRAEYGEQIVSTLSGQLGAEYGRGFSEKSIRHMLRFVEAFPDRRIVSALMRQLSWTHFLSIIYLRDSLQRDFYAEMCRIEHWSTRTLQKKIDSMFYERTALSKKPEDLARIELDALRDDDKLTPDLVFRDPYFLDFLGLTGAFQEKDLEAAILREMEAFILELGVDFSFVARQKRITLDGDDFYIDLLFFHRRLRCLVAVELKLGKFRPEHMGQMELYLRWLDKYERHEGENTPIGMILCAGKKQEQIEMLELGSLKAATSDEKKREELQAAAKNKDREHFRKRYLEVLIALELLERTIPDKPRSSQQRYRTTAAGRTVLAHAEKETPS
jgi:predicted nuclease of restriction endonuclease-like (RecB) superfamily